MASPERLVSEQQPNRAGFSDASTSGAGADVGTNSKVAGVASAGGLRQQRAANEVHPAADAARPSRAWRSPGLASTSSCRLASVACCHQFTISGFGLARSLGTGLRLCSDAFTAGDRQFRLEVFPGGAAAERTQHLSIFLTSTGGGGSSDLLYEVAILDQSGKGRHLARSCRPQPGPPAATGGDAETSAVMAGWPAFVRAALLEAHAARYLLGDRLVVRATVEVLHSWIVPPERLLPAPGRAALLPPAAPASAGGAAADGRTGTAAERCRPVQHAEQQQQPATTAAAGPAVDARSTAADTQAALLNQLGLLSLLQPGLEALQQQQARRGCRCTACDGAVVPTAAAAAADCADRPAAHGSSNSGATPPASPNAQQQQARPHQPAKQSALAAAAGAVIISRQPPGNISSNDSCSSQLAAAACTSPRLLLLPAVYEAQLTVQQQLLQQLLASCQQGSMDGSTAGCSRRRGPAGPDDEHRAADTGTALSTAQLAGSNGDSTSAAPPATAAGDHASLSADAGATEAPADVQQPADGAE